MGQATLSTLIWGSFDMTYLFAKFEDHSFTHSKNMKEDPKRENRG